MSSAADARRWPLATFLVIVVLASHGRAAEGPETRPIRLEVDVTRVAQRVLHARLIIPAAPGPLTLHFPKWIPGEHGPFGPIADLVGLRIAAADRDLGWDRDELDMYAFRIEVPEGVDAVEVQFDYLAAPPGASGYSASPTTSARLAVLNWNQLLLYPAGRPARQITYEPGLRLPPGWEFGTALEAAARDGDHVRFRPVSLETLIDSPVLCGLHVRQERLGPPVDPRHALTIACDRPAGLELDPGMKRGCDRLVDEAHALFGSRPYSSYRFLVALSDRVAHSGLEHHESSDNRAPERALIDPELRPFLGYLLPHEFVHAWNGKYRRPAGMVADDYQRPLRTRLLWVYEGLTDYLAVVLAARSGLWTDAQFREYLAVVAERQRNRRGRAWRPLADTAVAAQSLYVARREGASRRRSIDFYDEGILLWLEVDATIRERTAGRRSLDDFCRAFLGGQDGAPAVATYTLEDVVAALEGVAPHDWRSFLAGRVERPSAGAPLEGIGLVGWRLAYGDRRTAMQRGEEAQLKVVDLTTSLGLLLGEDATVIDVVPGEAADRAGVGPAMRLVGVNSGRYSVQALREAVAATRSGGPLELLMEDGEEFRTLALDYRGGERYPYLERDQRREDGLSRILAPTTPPGDGRPGAAPR